MLAASGASQTDTVLGELASAAMRFLMRDRSRGFPSATHRMIFPRSKGFTGPSQFQAGDVFARAIIADALCDARDEGFPEAAAVLDSECDYLVSRHQESTTGGWSYFPDLPELPPDIDVLAEVMQVLTRCGRWEDLRSHAGSPLSVVLRDGARPNGSFNIWIIPAANRSPVEARQAQFVDCAWGDTDDVEVVANFLYALTLYERPQYADLVQRSSKFVAGSQSLEGSWTSTWYVGPYYGTYVCCRLLAEIGDAQSLYAAKNFLESRQRADGGWGNGIIPGQLSTALALCALSEIGRRLGIGQTDAARMTRGVEALAYARALREGWYAAPFIRMNVGRPRGEAGEELIYRSSAITAAYALKAMTAVARSLRAAQQPA